MTKAWKGLKQEGRAALPANAQTAFDSINTLLSARGLFVIPCGEMESMLTEYGIAYTGDKKAWIAGAIQLVPGLEPNDAKQPWKYLKDIHDYLGT